MRIKYEYAGVDFTKRGLKVLFEVVTGGARRVQVLYVPWDCLTDTECLECIGNQVSKDLKERWARANEEAQQYLPWD